MHGERLLTTLFEDARTQEPDAISRLFDELWRLLNSAQGQQIAALLKEISAWAIVSAPATRIHALSEFTLGYASFFAAAYNRSVVYCLQAIELFKELDDEDGVTISMVVLGNSYRSMGASELAIRCYLRARQHQNGAYPIADLGSSYQLAEVYVEMGNYREALPLLEQALELVRQNHFAEWWEPRIINSQANTLVRTGETEKGLAAFETALSLSKEKEFLAVTARILTDLAEYHQSENELDLAIQRNEEAIAIRQGLQIRNALITNLLNLAAIYDQRQDGRAALHYLSQALPLAEALGMKAKQARIHELFSAVFERNGDIAQSLAHYKAYNQISDEASLEDSERKIENYKQIVEAEQTSRENSLIRKQKAEIEQKNTQLQDTVDALVLARDQLRHEKQRSDGLLLNILPEEIAEELKEHGSAEARQYEEVTVLFTDFKGFTSIAERLSPQQLVQELHTCFSAFDAIMEKHHIEKIKTVGDAYLAACGLPQANPDHAALTVSAAIAIRDFMLQRKAALGDMTFEVRIGIHTGSVVAGIVGVKKFAYDIWGDTVNTAARMEQHSEAGKVNISEATFRLAGQGFECTYRGMITAKNKGQLKMYFADRLLQ